MRELGTLKTYSASATVTTVQCNTQVYLFFKETSSFSAHVYSTWLIVVVLEGQSNENFDPPFSLFESAKAIDQWVKIFSILISIRFHRVILRGIILRRVKTPAIS